MEGMAGKLVEDEALYAKMNEALNGLYWNVHAIYNPEGTESDPYFGDCYCCAVDLFRPGLTFQIWFKVEDDKVVIRYGDRWHFG